MAKVGAGLPVAALKISVSAFFRRNGCAGGNGRIINPFKDIIHKLQVGIAFPGNLVLGKHVVIAAHTQPNRPILPVVDFGIGQGEEVQVNDVVQGPDGTFRDILQGRIIVHINMPQGQAGQVTDHKFTRLGYRHHHVFAVNAFNPLVLEGNGAHILGNFRAQVGAINHPLVLVWIGPVDRIPVKGKGRPCFHAALNDQANNVLNGQDPFGNPMVRYTVQVFFPPFISVGIFQGIALNRLDFMGAHEVPVPFNVVPGLLPKIIRITDRREHIMRLQPVVPIIGAQAEELGQVLMPHV